MGKKIPRPRPGGVIEVDDVNEKIEFEDSPLPPHDEDGDKLTEFLEQFGGKEYKVRVEQFNKDDKAWEYIDTFFVDGFDAYDVCKRFGRGRYRMTFLNEKGKYVPGGQPQIRIGGSATPVPVAAPAVEASDPLKHPMVIMMMANADAARKESSELIRAILTKPEPQKSSITELMEMMVKLEHLKPKQDDTTKKLMDAVMGRLIEKAIDPEPAASGGGLMSEAREGLAMLKESGVLDRISNRATQAPVKTLPTRVLPSEPPQMESPIIVAMRPYVSIFRMKAENGVEVDKAADYLIDEAYETLVPLIKKHVAGASLVSDDTVMENLINRASDATQVEELFKFAPELEPHRAWCVALIAKAVENMQNPEPEVNGNVAA